MNKLVQILVVTILLITVSCGKDGVSGNIYFAFDSPSGGTLTSYDDNNSDIPQGGSANYYWLTHAGTYSYNYRVDYGNYYGINSGTYTLYNNAGTKGGFLHSGKDGLDRHFDLKFYINASTYGANLTSYRLTQPIQIDTIYYSNGSAMRIKGTVTFGIDTLHLMPANYKQ